jgi:hypothetical protein
MAAQLLTGQGSFMEPAGDALAPLGQQEFAVRQQEQPVWSQPRLAASLFGGGGVIFP